MTILEQHLRNVVAAQPKALAQLFGWNPGDVELAIRRLVERGRADYGRLIRDVDADMVLSRDDG